jgi:hypothetical protein
MFRRSICFFLALVLLWSGFSAWEQPDAFIAADFTSEPLIAGAAEPGDRSAGTVADHHLDDQPSQSQGDPMPDLPGLLPLGLTARAMTLTMERPRQGDFPVPPTPCLARPEHPPRQAPVSA